MSSILTKSLQRNQKEFCAGKGPISVIIKLYLALRRFLLVPLNFWKSKSSMTEKSDLLDVCEAAARAGAAELMSHRGRFSTEEKSRHDLVTDADLASQQAIRDIVETEYPEHGFLGEESPDFAQLSQDYCWIVDPLDGTTNYVHQYPCYAVSVAVAESGQLKAGVIYDPLRQECFRATEGGGSFLNDEPIATSTTESLEYALLAVSFPPEMEEDSADLQAFVRVAPRCRAVRRTGSAALNLAYVACGRLDAHWAHFIHPWDSAAGVLLVREAGGVVTASRGDEFNLASGDYFVAGTQMLYDSLFPLVT